MIAIGVANPKAHGHDTTSTDIPILNDNSKSLEKIIHIIKVNKDIKGLSIKSLFLVIKYFYMSKIKICGII